MSSSWLYLNSPWAGCRNDYYRLGSSHRIWTICISCSNRKGGFSGAAGAVLWNKFSMALCLWKFRRLIAICLDKFGCLFTFRSKWRYAIRDGSKEAKGATIFSWLGSGCRWATCKVNWISWLIALLSLYYFKDPKYCLQLCQNCRELGQNTIIGRYLLKMGTHQATTPSSAAWARKIVVFTRSEICHRCAFGNWFVLAADLSGILAASWRSNMLNSITKYEFIRWVRPTSKYN